MITYIPADTATEAPPWEDKTLPLSKRLRLWQNYSPDAVDDNGNPVYKTDREMTSDVYRLGKYYAAHVNDGAASTNDQE